MPRILVVDDSQPVLAMLQRLLSSNGYEVVTATNGAEALEIGRNAPPDLVISDILMPVMDGYRLCRTWKEHERLRSVPFVFLTATYTDPRDERLAHDAGASAFLAKPVESERLLSVVREHLREAVDGPLPVVRDKEFEAEYAAALVRQLETKVLQLEEANLALGQEIANRESAEAALRDSELRLRTILSTVPDAVWTVDLESGTHTLLNRDSFCGHDRSGLASRGALLRLVHPQDRQAVAEAWDRCNRRGSLEQVVHRIARKDGRDEWIEQRVAVLPRGHDGSNAPLLVALRLITAQRQAEVALRQAEAAFRTLVEESLQGLLVVSEARLVFANQAAASMVGYQREELAGRALSQVLELVHSEDRELVRNRLAARLAGDNTPGRYEIRLTRRDGSLCWVEMSAARIDYLGTPSVQAVMVDITQRRGSEEALRHRLAELEAVARVSASIRGAETMPSMLAVLLDETLAALEADSGTILLWDSERHRLTPVVSRGWLEALTDLSLAPGEGIAGAVFSDGRVYRSEELAQDPGPSSQAAGRIPPGWSGICVPVHAGREVVGVLFLSVRQPRRITTDEERVLTSLADMAGTAIHRMRLYEEAVRRMERLQALSAIDRAIVGSLDSRVTLSIVLEQSCAKLGVDAAGVLLFDPTTSLLEYGVGCGFRTRGYERSRLRLGEGVAGRAALERRVIRQEDVRGRAGFTREALVRGESFVGHGAVPLVAKGQLKGVLEVFHRSALPADAEWAEFLTTLAGQAAIAVDNIELFERLQRSNTDLTLAYDTTIEGWSRALDLRDRETEGHSQRVTELTIQLARAVGMRAEELAHVKRGALLHDIGKMGIPDAILLKPGPLTEDEWAVMRRHPQIAYDLLSPINYLRPAIDIPYCHHERWDGAGYPRGLRTEQIPVAARLFSVVDVWDALRSDRPYRPGWAEAKVIAHIQSMSGQQFDPAVVPVFVEMLTRRRVTPVQSP